MTINEASQKTYHSTYETNTELLLLHTEVETCLESQSQHESYHSPIPRPHQHYWRTY